MHMILPTSHAHLCGCHREQRISFLCSGGSRERDVRVGMGEGTPAGILGGAGPGLQGKGIPFCKVKPAAACCYCQEAQVGDCRNRAPPPHRPHLAHPKSPEGFPSPTYQLSVLTVAACSCRLAVASLDLPRSGLGQRSGMEWSPLLHAHPHTQFSQLAYWGEPRPGP